TAGDPGGHYAYVTDAKRGEVVVVDLFRGRVIRRLEVGPLARHISIDPQRRTLWIALGAKARELAVVAVSRATHLRVLRRLRPPFLAHDVAFTPSGEHVWISSGNLRELAVYDAHKT